MNHAVVHEICKDQISAPADSQAVRQKQKNLWELRGGGGERRGNWDGMVRRGVLGRGRWQRPLRGESDLKELWIGWKVIEEYWERWGGGKGPCGAKPT